MKTNKRKKSISRDGVPRIKYTSYDHIPFKTNNVIHVGVYGSWVYYFGYTYSPMKDKISQAKKAGMNESILRTVEGIEAEIESIVNIIKEENNKEKKSRNSLQGGGKSSSEEEKINNTIREMSKGIIKYEKRLKALRKKLIKASSSNNDLILKKLFLNSPMGHTVTGKGIVRTPKVPSDKIMVIEEVFFAYEKVRGGIKDVEQFMSMMTKYNYDNTFFHLHGRFASKAQLMINNDPKNALHKRVLYLPNDEHHKHIVPTLFGKIPKRLSKFQGNSYYKYIYDPNFFNPELPFMFKIKHSHVIIKPDIAIDDKDGKYQLLLLDYNEKEFNESSKEVDELYSQEVSDTESDNYRPNHEYVGAISSGLNMTKIGMKHPPKWLARLLKGFAKYDSRDFLMCRAEEFTDQWFLLLMEHFDDFDYDISREISPFIGSPGMFLLTGDSTFRVFKPRWLTLMINDYIKGHDNGDVYHTDLMFLEEGLEKGTKQRTPRAFLSEDNIVFPVSTPFGKVLIEEGVNFPNHGLWHNIKDVLTEAYVSVGKQVGLNHMFTSTTLKTKEYSFRFHSIYENVTTPFSNMSNYNDYLAKGSYVLTQPDNYKDNLRTSGQCDKINGYIEEKMILGMDVNLESFDNITNNEYYFGRTDSKDYNLVTIDSDVIINNKMIEGDYGKVVDSSRNEHKDLNTVVEPYTTDGTKPNRLLIAKRGNQIFHHEIKDYHKANGNPDNSNEGNIKDIEILHSNMNGES